MIDIKKFTLTLHIMQILYIILSLIKLPLCKVGKKS